MLAALGACDGDECGPGDAPTTITVEGNGVALEFGELFSSQNNDCTDLSTGVVSVTIHGKHLGSDLPFTLCIERPDLLTTVPQQFGPDDPGVDFHIVDVSASEGGCDFVLDRDAPINGTATGSGVCANGTDLAGYALTLDGTFTLTRTCGAAVDAVAVTLSGTIAVAQEP